MKDQPMKGQQVP